MRSVLIVLVLLLASWSQAAFCPSRYQKILTETSGVCDEGQDCDATSAPCDSGQGCGTRVVTGVIGSPEATGVACPSGWSKKTLSENLTEEVNSSVSQGVRQRWCFVAERATTRVFIGITGRPPVGQTANCSRISTRVEPPTSSGLNTVSTTASLGQNVTFPPSGAGVTVTGGTVAAGVYLVEVRGAAPVSPCSSNAYTISAEADYAGGTTAITDANKAEMCVGITNAVNILRVETTDRTDAGCGTVKLSVTDSSTGQTKALNRTGTNTVVFQATSGSALTGPFEIVVEPGSGPAPSGATPCFGSRLYTLKWSAQEVPPQPGETPEPTPRTTPGGGPTRVPTITPLPRSRTCPPGYRQIASTWCPPGLGQCWDGGIDDTISAGELARFCILPKTGTVDDGGVDRRSPQHPENLFVSSLTIDMVSNNSGGTLVSGVIIPSLVTGLSDVDVPATAAFRRALGSRFAPVPAGEATLIELSGGASGTDRLITLRWNATGNVAGPTPTPTPGAGPTPTPLLVAVPWNTPGPPSGTDALLGIQNAVGPYVSGGFSRTGMTTFNSFVDFIFIAPYYYHWDRTNRSQTTSMSMHPSEWPQLKDYGWNSSLWHQKNIRDMSAAGINVMAVVYQGFPVSNSTGGVYNENWWANGALPGIVGALDALKGSMQVPKVTLQIPIDFFLDSKNPLRRLLHIHAIASQDDLRYLSGAIRDFYSQIPPEHWAQIDHQPIIILGPPAQTKATSTIHVPRPEASQLDVLRKQFRRYFDGKDPIFLVDSAYWGTWAGSTTTKNSAQLISIQRPMINSVSTMQIIRDPEKTGDNLKYTFFGPGWDASKWNQQGSTLTSSTGRYGSLWGTALGNAIPNPFNSGLTGERYAIWYLDSWNHFWQGNVIGDSYELGTDLIDVTVENVNVFRKGADFAEFVSQTLPIFGSNQMIRGTTGTATITYWNTGTTTWSKAAGYNLGSQNPQDNTTWGDSRFDLGTAVVPGGAFATFNMQVTAPTTTGTYNFQWQMLHEGKGWFGDKTTNVAIQVVAPTATPTPGPTPTASPLPTVTGAPVTPTLTPSPTPEPALPPTPESASECPEGYVTLQPPFGIPGVCYYQGRPDRPITTPDEGRCPTGYYLDTTSPWGNYCRPLSTPIPGVGPALAPTPAPTFVTVPTMTPVP